MSATALALEPRVAVRSGARRTIALAGCGVVGGALAELVENARCAAAADLELTCVLVREPARPRPQLRSRDLLTDAVETFLGVDADVVVEATGDVPLARRIAVATLRRGGTFVTANKALVAAAGGELATIARAHGGSLRFDAAVAGGVPLLRVLATSLGGRAPARIRGILNGTSNFVLSALEGGATLHAALREARDRGFAEADASRDLDGRDAAEKLALVAWVAHGVEPERVVVRRSGLLPDPGRLVRLAQAVGGRLRLVAECELTARGELLSSVEPTIVDPRSALGLTVGVENRVEVHTGWGAPLTLAGPGAGGGPTATALLSDVFADGDTVSLRRDEPRPADDDRALHWALGADVDVRALAGVLGLAGLDVIAVRDWPVGDAADADAAAWALVGPCEPAVVERAAAGLPAAARAVVARVDADVVRASRP